MALRFNIAPESLSLSLSTSGHAPRSNWNSRIRTIPPSHLHTTTIQRSHIQADHLPFVPKLQDTEHAHQLFTTPNAVDRLRQSIAAKIDPCSQTAVDQHVAAAQFLERLHYLDRDTMNKGLWAMARMMKERTHTGAWILLTDKDHEETICPQLAGFPMKRSVYYIYQRLRALGLKPPIAIVPPMWGNDSRSPTLRHIVDNADNILVVALDDAIYRGNQILKSAEIFARHWQCAGRYHPIEMHSSQLAQAPHSTFPNKLLTAAVAVAHHARIGGTEWWGACRIPLANDSLPSDIFNTLGMSYLTHAPIMTYYKIPDTNALLGDVMHHSPTHPTNLKRPNYDEVLASDGITPLTDAQIREEVLEARLHAFARARA